MDFIEIDSGTSEARLAASELQGSSLRDSPLGDSRSSGTSEARLAASPLGDSPLHGGVSTRLAVTRLLFYMVFY